MFGLAQRPSPAIIILGVFAQAVKWHLAAVRRRQRTQSSPQSSPQPEPQAMRRVEAWHSQLVHAAELACLVVAYRKARILQVSPIVLGNVVVCQ